VHDRDYGLVTKVIHTNPRLLDISIFTRAQGSCLLLASGPLAKHSIRLLSSRSLHGCKCPPFNLCTALNCYNVSCSNRVRYELWTSVSECTYLPLIHGTSMDAMSSNQSTLLCIVIFPCFLGWSPKVCERRKLWTAYGQSPSDHKLGPGLRHRQSHSAHHYFLRTVMFCAQYQQMRGQA
jgi:hypothetical protein